MKPGLIALYDLRSETKQAHRAPGAHTGQLLKPQQVHRQISTHQYKKRAVDWWFGEKAPTLAVGAFLPERAGLRT